MSGRRFKKKISHVVKLAVIGTPLFFAGCGVSDTVVIERRVADRVEVVDAARPGYHFSYYYGGYVPIYVPIGGFIGPRYYSGGYRPPQTVVRNYITTHRPAVVRSPQNTSSVTTPARNTTHSTVTTTAPKPGVSTSVSAGVRPSAPSARIGGFGSTGRGGAGVSS